MAKLPDHLARAKEALAIAESDDSKREAYRIAAEEIAAHKKETGEPNTRIAIRLGCDEKKVRVLLSWRERGYDTDSPYNEGFEKKEQQRAQISHTRRVLREKPAEVVPEIAKAMEDPKVAKKVMRQLSDKHIDNMAEAGHGVVVERLEAKRDEENAKLPKKTRVKDLLPDQEDVEKGPFGLLTATWLDQPLSTAHSRMHTIETGMREHGVIFGSMSDEKALEYAEYIERIAAELRVALQERVRDAKLAEQRPA